MHRKVAGVGRFTALSERSRERNRQRLVKGLAEGDPEAERYSLAVTKFDLADARLVDIDQGCELALRQALPLAARPNTAPESRNDRVREPLGLTSIFGLTSSSACGVAHESDSCSWHFACR